MNTAPLHPDHLADLRRSGLNDDTIVNAGIFSVTGDAVPAYVGLPLGLKVESAAIFPYSKDFYRGKLFPPVPGSDGHMIRYYQAAGTPPRLYIPPRAQAVLDDPTVPLLVVEGEKKALKADQEGLVTVAVGGLWSWLTKGKLIPDLAHIDWYERVGLLVPDSDVWTRPDLLQPVYALGKELEERGATVSVVKLPAGEGGIKVGLDDFLLVHTVAEFQALPRLDLKHSVFTKTAKWWKGWQKRKETGDTRVASAIEILERGEATRSLHPAQDVANGVLFYGFQHEQQLVILTSERKAFRAGQLPEGLTLRHTEPGPSSISRDAALSWLTKRVEEVSVASVIDALRAFFARYVIFRDKRHPLLLATWTFGTYIYKAFSVYAYLHLLSATARCAKTRVLKLISRVGFNATPVIAIPTEAQLFREAEQTGGVQLFDEMDGLKGDRERWEALISVLNVGFEAGGFVSRLEKRGNEFVPIRYEIYVPRALAGLSGFKETLEDRALPLFMVRRRHNERIARLTRAVEPEAQALRDQCALACLSHVGNVLTAYDRAPKLLERETIDDRAVDLWASLIALTLVADAEDDSDRTKELLGLARAMSEVRDAGVEDEIPWRLIQALQKIRNDRQDILTPGELLTALRDEGFDWIRSTKHLAGLLNPLGLVSHTVRRAGKTLRAYGLDAESLTDLKTRFSPASGEPEEGA